MRFKSRQNNVYTKKSGLSFAVYYIFVTNQLENVN
jgi:hypothetical protein